MASAQHTRKMVRHQAEQDGAWVRADVWFGNTDSGELVKLSAILGEGDPAILRAQNDDTLEAIGKLAQITLRELAFRRINSMQEAEG
jgi:hypothetical protein